MNLVDKQYVTGRKIRQQCRKVARMRNRGTARNAQGHPHLIGNDPGKRRFAESRRAVQQRMVERFAARFGRFDINLHMLLDRVLTDVLGKTFRSERNLDVAVIICDFRRYHTVVGFKDLFTCFDQSVSPL